MPPHEFAKGVMIICNDDTRDEVRIWQLHARLSRTRVLGFQLPYDNIADADAERDEAEAPR